MKKIFLITVSLIFISIINSCSTGCSEKESKKQQTTVAGKSDTDSSSTVKIVNNKIIKDTVFVKVPEKNNAKIPSLNAWNNKSQNKIKAFIKNITDKNSKSFISKTDRIAAFDLDGTLWPEKPVYFQMEFVFDRIKSMYKDHPEWKRDKLIQAVLKRDLEKIRRYGTQGLLKLSRITQTGMTTDKYCKIVKQWIDTARNPETGMKYKDMAYLPMLQLIKYLKHYGFKVYMVSEDGSGFLKPWVKEVFDINPENVIASRRVLTLQEENGKIVLFRESDIEFVNNRENKVVSLQQIPGKKPVVVFGNSDDDYYMMKWTAQRSGSTLVGIIHHTDKKREWAYDKDSRIGRLNKVLKVAAKNNWFVVDMKNDWKKIYTK